MQIFLIIALLFAVVAVIFAVQNVAAVTITFFSWSLQTSLAVALLVALGTGILIVILFSIPGKIKNSRASFSQKKKFASLEAERDRFQKKVDEITAERDQTLKKLEESRKEISELEEQLASVSAMLPEKETGTPPNPGAQVSSQASKEESHPA